MPPTGTVSLWADTAPPPPAFPRLSRGMDADICVIGGGIAGLTTAYLLAKEGRKVLLLEGADIGGGQSIRTSAHLTCVLEERAFVLRALHGTKTLAKALEAHNSAVDTIERICAEEGIDCDFLRVSGYLVLGPDDSKAVLQHELRTYHRAGLAQVELLPKAPLSFWDSGPCLHVPRQGQFHPGKYLRGLALAAQRAGAQIFTHSAVRQVRDGGGLVVETRDGHEVRAGAVVVATNTPFTDRVAIHTKQAAYRSMMLGFIIPRHAVPDLLLWDTEDPYHFVRVQRLNATQDILEVGGEDYKTGQADDHEARFARLEAWTRQNFPMAGERRYAWSGQWMAANDGLAFIGPDPAGRRGVYVVTGDSGNGLTHGTAAGLLLKDEILGVKNGWSEVFDAGRKMVSALPRYLKENGNVLLNYGRWLVPGRERRRRPLEPGEGAVCQVGWGKAALYRDITGKVYRCGAACTHLGGQVRWNSLEMSWDCPLHGSRFDAEGSVIEGPAITGLKSGATPD
jgi:glycine/D-amino acid oxidase-like deaminating enzyme/nitrite reductase/ring-hydroxylating ferredoxin subunit